MIRACHEGGLPEDQARRFLAYGYYPLVQMMPFHRAAREADREGGAEEIGLGGTRGPGKSHATLAQVGLDDLQRTPGLKWLFLRKVQKSAAESLEDLVYKVFRDIPHEYVPSQGRIRFGNGSRVLLGGYNSERDIDKYLGVEYDGATIEEATQLSETKVNKIRGSVRTSRTDWRPRVYYTTNPDGIGLQWFKRRFVISHRQGRESGTRFIDATYQGNPFLNAGYIRYLESLTGPLARAWREADWDAFEGQAFPEFRYELHVVEPSELPARWLRWRAVDWGYAAPFCCLWFAKDIDSGRVMVYREAYETQLDDAQQAQRIVDLTEAGEKIAHTYADPSSYWVEKKLDGQVYTPEKEYRRAGVHLIKADNSRIPGKRRVHRALAPLPDGKPGLQIFSTCPRVIEQLGALIYDRVHVEDVDTNLEDHAYDALRYGLSNFGAGARKRDERKAEREREEWEQLRKHL